MPRVSDEYLEQRRQQILDAARRCFARQGFYETTMQDVFAESGLSAGAVYRYFKTKDDLIQAISATALGQLGAVIEDALAEDPLPGLDEIAGRIATTAQELSGPDGPARIGPAAWAAALHDPRVAEIVRDVFGALRTQWATAVRRMVHDGRLAEGTDVEAAASALFALVPGFVLQYLILADIDADVLRSGLRALLRPAALSPGNG
ncbi:MAG TPA: TetR/AcrR family transcriptional regulator [Trebonia sp.]|jgi:AcrR family transcriptional regulator|nr:TetR/AcrR family transcriptional regulator [Trebonia sp.]